MDSRAVVNNAIEHKAGRIPLDFGGSPVTGMHVSMVYKLRQALELDRPGTLVKVIEPFQMLGEIGLDLMERLGVDVIGVGGSGTIFGFKNKDWKEWHMADRTPVLVPGKFNTDLESNGEIFMYPQGDKSARPSGKMPQGGYFFDAIVRQESIDEEKLNVADNLEEFGPITDAELNHFKTQISEVRRKTDKAIFANFGGMAFGDITLVPAPWMKNPKGIRGIEEWYMSLLLRRDYVYKLFERQCEIAVKNLDRIFAAIGNDVDVVYMTGTDFGTQAGPFMSNQMYREMFKPFHKALNEWVHKHTKWKTFMHSCGSICALLEDFIEAGFDILNPVQCSAAGMEAAGLKARFGERVTFWGGGVDTQQVFPFGTVRDVEEQVIERMKIFGKNGGFVFNTIHNVQARTPIENVVAMLDTFNKYRDMYI